MRVGVPKEIKNHEYRVGLVPPSVAELVHRGHEVLVECGAGMGAGLQDREYEAAGATIVGGPDDRYGRSLHASLSRTRRHALGRLPGAR
jgi:alanine dehydrogenase